MNIIKIVAVTISLASVLSACSVGNTNATFSGATLSSISVTPANTSITKGTTRQLTATGTYSDGTRKNITSIVAWSSSTSTVAIVSNATGSHGLVTSVASGTATISATDPATSIKGSTTVAVTVQIGGSIQGNPLSLSAVVTTLAGQAGTNGHTDGTGTAALFNFPTSITTDGTNLYVSDNGAIIRKVVISSGVVTTIAGTAGSFGYLDGAGTAAIFNGPNGLTTDGTYLYVSEIGNNTIRKIDLTSGVVMTLAGTAGVSGSVDGIGTAASFNAPNGLTMDGANLYVADSINNTIRKIVISSGEVTTLAGSAGVSGSTDGTGTSALFSFPIGITTDGTNLYVTEAHNHTIRKIVISSGVVTTLAGTTGVSGFSDGLGTSARFNSPYGITTDGTYLYVPDTYNCTIRKVVISSGEVTTLAGTAIIYGSTDGIGADAHFYLPNEITTDGTSLYVVDIYSVRKIN